jgi:hypothetical protein
MSGHNVRRIISREIMSVGLCPGCISGDNFRAIMSRQIMSGRLCPGNNVRGIMSGDNFRWGNVRA